MSPTNNLDPLKFLNVNVDKLSEQEIQELRDHLSSKIGEYILLKLSDHFSPDQQEKLGSVTKPEELQKLLNTIPLWNEKIKMELANFKTEYLNKVQKGLNG